LNIIKIVNRNIKKFRFISLIMSSVIEDKIEIRKILHTTIIFDHDIIDGAPAARFLTKLKEYIESGFGLNQ